MSNNAGEYVCVYDVGRAVSYSVLLMIHSSCPLFLFFLYFVFFVGIPDSHFLHYRCQYIPLYHGLHSARA